MAIVAGSLARQHGESMKVMSPSETMVAGSSAANTELEAPQALLGQQLSHPYRSGMWIGGHSCTSE